MASLSTLPVELVNILCDDLHPADLAALAATDVRLYRIAHRPLYRHLVIDNHNLTCIFTLARNPHIAALVRSFSIRLAPCSFLLRSFYRLLATALSNMNEITSLHVSIDQAASWIMATRDDASYHRLTHFSSAFHLDDNLVHFLNKTDALLELELDPRPSNPPLLGLRDGALPLLKHFAGSSQAAQYLVPGRPVENIHLSAGDLTEEVAVSLSKSTASILVLAAATSSHSVSLIGTLTRCMEHLVHLRIVTTYNFSHLPDTTYFSDIADALTSLPDLQSCEIWGLHWISAKKSFHDQGRVWESESFNNTYIPANTLLTNPSFLDDLYSDFSFAY